MDAISVLQQKIQDDSENSQRNFWIFSQLIGVLQEAQLLLW